jgi:hypothetical protein
MKQIRVVSLEIQGVRLTKSSEKSSRVAAWYEFRGLFADPQIMPLVQSAMVRDLSEMVPDLSDMVCDLSEGVRDLSETAET